VNNIVIPRKLVRLIKMCLNETCSKIRIDKHLSGAFPIQNGLKQGDVLSPLHITHQLLVYADDVNLLGENISIIKKNAEALLDASKEIGLEVNYEKTKYMFMSPSPECRAE
jgi:hypothetical protein